MARPHPARLLHLLVALALSNGAWIGCGGPSIEKRDGVTYAEGNTAVEMSERVPGQNLPPGRAATFDDALEVTVEIACAHPDGISDVARRAAISRALEKRGIDQASFDAAMAKAADELAFAEGIATQMGQKCPDSLTKVLERSQPAPE